MRYTDLITENDDSNLFGKRPTTIGRQARAAIKLAGREFDANQKLILVAPDSEVLDDQPATHEYYADLVKQAHKEAPSYLEAGYEPRDVIRIQLVTNDNWDKLETLGKYTLAELSSVTEDDNDDEMFGAVPATGQQTRQHIAAAQFSDNIPVFVSALKQFIDANASRYARELTREASRTVRAFAGSEEITELAYDMFTIDTPKSLHRITQWVAENPARATDEDELHDYLSNLAEDIRHSSELWVYINEWLEDMYDDGDDNPGQMEEYEFDLAMTVSGELADLLSKGIQQAFDSASRAIAVNEGSTNQYQQMLRFAQDNKAPGIPPDQQIAFALYKELQNQQQKNKELGDELDAAEKRIDVAAQGGELSKQELGKHQTELEKERGAIAQQQSNIDALDQAHSQRELVSKQKIADLASKLEKIKSKPEISDTETKRLENEIKDLKKNGIAADKFRELEQHINSVQNMHHVDDQSMKDLIAKITNAEAKATELEKTKQEFGQGVDQTTAQILDQLDQMKQQLANLRNMEHSAERIDQIQQQMAHFRDVERTVSVLYPTVQDILVPKVNQLSKQQGVAPAPSADQIARQQKIDSYKTNPPAVDARTIANKFARANSDMFPQAAKYADQTTAMARNQIQSRAGAGMLPGRENEKKLHESLTKAIKWATGKK